MSATQIPSLTSFTPSTTISSSEVNANFAAIRNQFNALVNSDTTLAVPAGTGSQEYHPSGRVASETTNVATSGTTNETLATYAIPTDSLNANGKAVRITAWGQGAANANNKVLTLVVDSNVGGITISGSSEIVMLEAVVMRTGASAGDVFLRWTTNGASTDQWYIASITPTWDSASAINVNFNALTASASGDFTFHGWLIEYLG